MNLQRREEIREIAKEFRRLFLHEQAEAIDELLAHVDTLEQAAGLLNLSLDELYARLGLVADFPSSTSLSDAAAQMGMGLSDFKHQLFE